MKMLKVMAVVLAVFLGTVAMNGMAEAASTAVRFQTNMGDFVVRVDAAKAPETVKNFLQYVKTGHYDGTVFHRVIKGFMIQGGGMTPDLKTKPTNAPIKIESANGLDNDVYTLAMARTQDPNSATSQFFINTEKNDFLNYKAPTMQGWGYTVFGKVIKGQEVVKKIENVATGNRGFHENVPREPVIIEKASIVE